MNQPILLKPSGKDYLWGGQRLNDEFAKGIDLSPLAETWECSTHPDGPSIADHGQFKGLTLAEVIREHPGFLGKKYEGLTELPILIKMIDANQDLSVQVHPDDTYAQKYENGQQGKTEMWVVLDATKDARLVYGFNHDMDEAMVKSAIEDGSLMQHLNLIPVKKGDLFFIEAGTVHAIGKGVLIAEIQENSNLTYRLYDYDRKGKDGKKRPLHIDRALAVANLKTCIEPKQPLRVLKYSMGIATELLRRCPYFEVYRMIVNTERRQQVFYHSDEFRYTVLLCVGGCGSLYFGDDYFDFCKGDCIFVPADCMDLRIHGQAQFLNVRG